MDETLMPAAERAAYANGYEAGLHTRLKEMEELKRKLESLRLHCTRLEQHIDWQNATIAKLTNKETPNEKIRCR